MGYTLSEGQGSEDCLIAKLDAEGNKEWMRIIGGTNLDELSRIVKL